VLTSWLLWDRFTGVDYKLPGSTWRLESSCCRDRPRRAADPPVGISRWTRPRLGARPTPATRSRRVRLAMFAPLLVDGKRLSHPIMIACGVPFVIWHDGHVAHAIRTSGPTRWCRGWTDNDQWSSVKVVTGMFQRVAPQVALCDLAATASWSASPNSRSPWPNWVEWSLALATDRYQYEIHSSLMGEPSIRA